MGAGQMEADKLHEVQKVAIMEAEKELKRLADDEEKRTEMRKRAGFGILAAKPKCDLCEVRSWRDIFSCSLHDTRARRLLSFS